MYILVLLNLCLPANWQRANVGCFYFNIMLLGKQHKVPWFSTVWFAKTYIQENQSFYDYWSYPFHKAKDFDWEEHEAHKLQVSEEPNYAETFYYMHMGIILHAIVKAVDWFDKRMEQRFPGMPLVVFGRVLQDYNSALWYLSYVLYAVAFVKMYQWEEDLYEDGVRFYKEDERKSENKEEERKPRGILTGYIDRLIDIYILEKIADALNWVLRLLFEGWMEAARETEAQIYELEFGHARPAPGRVRAPAPAPEPV